MKPAVPIKIAMICAQYPPAVGPGPTRMFAFANGLKNLGLKPKVFTSELAPGSKAARWRELKDHTQVEKSETASRIGRHERQSTFLRIMNAIVPLEPIWMLSLAHLEKVFAQSSQGEAPDVVFTSSNPLAVAVGGMRLKRRHGIPLLVEFRDPWTTNPVRYWPTWLHYQAENWLERRVLRMADAIIMNTPTARADLLAKYTWLEPARVHVIGHGFDGEPSLPSPTQTSRRALPSNEISIGYAGGFYIADDRDPNGATGLFARIRSRVRNRLRYSIARDDANDRDSTPAALLEAVAKFNSNAAPGGLRFRVDFIGTPARQIEPLVRQFDLSGCVRFRPRVPETEIRGVLSSFEILYLTNPAIDRSPFVGTKTLDYFAAGRPILAELPDSDQANLVRRTDSGWICRPRDVDDLHAKLTMIAANQGEALIHWCANREAILELSRAAQTRDLIDVIEQVCGIRHPSAVISAGYA